MQPTDNADEKLAFATNMLADTIRGMAMAGGFGLDAKRTNAWCEFGYIESPTFETFYRLYMRGGIPHGAVTKMTDTCWTTLPELIEGDEEDDSKDVTAWERDTNKKLKDCDFWDAFKEADVRRLVGRYAGIILQMEGAGREWSDAVSGTPVLKKLIPAWEGQLKPKTFDEDKTSETYGDVTMWAYKESELPKLDSHLSSGMRELDIHPSRVIILGDIHTGRSWLEPGLNACSNMEKVSGGSAESYLKNAARQLGINFEKDTDLDSIARSAGVKITELQGVFDGVVRDINRGRDAALITKGAQVNALTATVPDPIPPFDVSLQEFAASVMMPAKIIVGNQTGERASVEDVKDFKGTCQSRRVNRLAKDIRQATKHLIDIGFIKAVTEFSVIWDNLLEPTEMEKLEKANKMADTNQKSIAMGAPVFSIEELRTAAGYDNDELPEPLEDADDEDAEEDDPAATPPVPAPAPGAVA